ncbi:MAG TPA: AI-2E family transporter [Acidimicrobiales bacterium]|nr:AI-2E family transporter [Acidimicrobiales bacterium]
MSEPAADGPEPVPDPEAGGQPPPPEVTLLLPPNVDAPERGLARRGPPVDRRAPFYIGFTGALGVATAYLIVRALAGAGTVLVIVGLSLFLAIGLNPMIGSLTQRGLSRATSALIVVAALLAVLAAFAVAAVPPSVHEVRALVHKWPTIRHDVTTGSGPLGHALKVTHLTGVVGPRLLDVLKTRLSHGLFGAGKVVVTTTAAALSVLVLTVYFLIALPSVRTLWLRLAPRSRRERVAVLTDEVFDRVGGFVLGNLVTSAIAGAGTFVWLLAVGGPYPVLLGMFVALFDLIPIVGSTVAGLVVSMIALSHGVFLGIATLIFYVVYRLLEDYFLTPRVMRHTVSLPPGVTIVATLAGGALLGLLGALIAIPAAATLHLILEEVLFPRLERR